MDVDKEYTRERVGMISSVILQEERRVREKYKWLAWQDTLCCIWFFSCLFSIILFSSLYLHDIIPWWITVCFNGIALSIFHELEHDLIHNMYFKAYNIIQDLMLSVIWLGKLHANPWHRKIIHLKHHKVSGQINDIEERLVGLGLPFGLKRLAVTVHPFASVLQFGTLERDIPNICFDRMSVATLPTGAIFYVAAHLFVLHLLSDYIFPLKFMFSLVPFDTWPLVRDIVVLWVLPNLIRNMSLLLMTTSCHYYGDIPKNNLYYQNQIIQHPLVWPFQIFCFNFAATHIIHHYVPSQPFYIRQMIASPVHEVMVKQGVRKNDFGVIFRGNSYKRNPDDANKELLVYFAFCVLCIFFGLSAVVVLNFTLLYTTFLELVPKLMEKFIEYKNGFKAHNK